MPAAAGWRARLALDFERRAAKTVLARRVHDGPLVVQKALYPEGESVCHAIVVHPPAGIAGGDALVLSATLGPAAHALLTTPGAGKWYRSSGAMASQTLEFSVGEGALLEWLPQESIVFDGARAALATRVRLAAGARYIGWEVLCLGRTGSGERFVNGLCRLETSVLRDENLLWLERGGFAGDDPLLHSPAGFGGHPVCGTMLAFGPVSDALLEACRAVESPYGAVTRMPEFLVGRYLGPSGAEARAYFSALWRVLRPAFAGIEASDPRIWAT